MAMLMAGPCMLSIRSSGDGARWPNVNVSPRAECESIAPTIVMTSISFNLQVPLLGLFDTIATVVNIV